MGGGEKEEEGGITIMTADVVDIGIFIVFIVFCCDGKGGGGGSCIVTGVIFLSLFLIVLLGALGVYSWLLGCWMIEIFDG